MNTEKLQAALRAVPCLYASKAEIRCHLQGAASDAPEVSWSDYLSELVIKVAELPRSVDILAIEVPIHPAAAPRDLLARGVHSLLAGLLRLSGSACEYMYQDIETDLWEYRVLAQDFFPFVLSPIYGVNHPRHLAWGRPILLLQPEASFTKFGISSQSEDRERISTATEGAFAKAGKHYYGTITRSLPKAFRVIKPPSESEPPIRWWETKLLTS